MKQRRGNAGAPGGYQPPARWPRLRSCRTAACGSARWRATRTRRTIRWCGSVIRCWRRRFCPAPRRSCATWPPTAAICCSAPAAITSMIRPSSIAISANPGQGCDAIDGFNRIHAILGASDAVHRDASFRHVRGTGGAGRHGAGARPHGRAEQSRSLSFTACPGTTPQSIPTCAPDELILLDRSAAKRRMRSTPLTSRCATARATPSRWSRWQRRWRWMAGRIRSARTGAGRGGPQAVARGEGGAGAGGQAGRPRRTSRRLPRESAGRRAGPTNTTRSKWRLAKAEPSCAPSTVARRDKDRHDHHR